MNKVLVIQTAFIGDVILATSFIESLDREFAQDLKIDVLVRSGNEGLLKGNPKIRKILVWEKKKGKYKNLLALSKTIRKEKYDAVYNLQRFASTGFLTWRSGAKQTVGFRTNPLSFLFHFKVAHQIGDGRHEVDRNLDLVRAHLTLENDQPAPPKLYPSPKQKLKVKNIIKDTEYYVMAPVSVWFTKQLPKHKWIELVQKVNQSKHVFFVGGPDDTGLIQEIIDDSKMKNAVNLAGQLSLLESAVLIANAKRTFVNDSAPLHLASAMNAPVTAFFCSTVPKFGFGPLSSNSTVLEVSEKLTCRPCGLHGKNACPKNHFKCGNDIEVSLC